MVSWPPFGGLLFADGVGLSIFAIANCDTSLGAAVPSPGKFYVMAEAGKEVCNDRETRSRYD
jgi:hypothetical protein